MSEGKVVVDISMPLDGFVTGPNPDVERGLGGGEPLHECNRKVLQEGIAEEGAVIPDREGSRARPGAASSREPAACRVKARSASPPWSPRLARGR